MTQTQPRVQAAPSTQTLTIVNPVATPRSHAGGDRFPPAPRPATLDGATVALYWNGKQNGLDALARARELIAERFTGVTFVELTGALGGTTRYLDDEQLAFIERQVDAVVATTADCGSCCSWLVRDLCEVERRGVPAIGYTAAIFDEDARFSAKTFGVPEACPLIVPDCFSNKGTDEIRTMVDDSFDELVELLTTPRAVYDVLPEFDSMVLEGAPELHFDGADLMDAFDAMQRRFVANGWSDGLPLVPPTRRKVAAMVEASGLDGAHEVGDFAPGFGIGTVEKIAANAVMAGCRPEAMPVLMAVMECVLDPSIGLRTWAMSTGPQAPLILVSGPIADEIGMNRGICALGPGSISEVNVAIGRALRLVMMNVGLSYPGITDMDTIGTPMKFSACVAENEERTPWEPWRVQQGFAREQSTVTVNVPYGMTEFFDFQNSDPDKLVESWSTLTAHAVGTPSAGAWLIKKDAPLSAGYPFHGAFSNMLLMAPDHAAAFADAGWGPAEIREAIHRRTKLPFRQVMLNQSMPAFEISHPELRWLLDAPETPVTVNPSADCFEFFVVGAKAGRSQFCFGGTNSVTRPVAKP
ncbi:UGSC family (seleno)protein [Phytohabitans kaempferiae]|uniref:UGSC-like domain-containing protein n=1 Tax=Phytohabitans kaempferiae TaxID=1620943 RepID=A0ABV6LXZ9_9ACTN